MTKYKKINLLQAESLGVLQAKINHELRRGLQLHGVIFKDKNMFIQCVIEEKVEHE